MKKISILILVFFFTFTAWALGGTAPSAPSNLRSLTHSIGVPSSDTIIIVRWMSSTDPDGDLHGYGTKWDNSPDTTLTSRTHEASDISAQSESLADGTWYFHIRAIDDEYNRSDTVHLGPFIIKTEPVMGDINGDNRVGLADAILVLQVCISLNSSDIQMSGEVNSDGKIGLEEMIYILRKVSGFL